jgi:hypothetical protein
MKWGWCSQFCLNLTCKDFSFLFVCWDIK